MTPTSPREARSGAARGTTLVETMIAVLILGGVLGSFALVGNSSRRAYGTEVTGSELEAQASRTVERIAQEFILSSPGTLVPDPAQGVGADNVTYLKAVGAPGGVVAWSNTFRLRFEYETGEVDDGVDNNGNGAIDEGRVVWTANVGTPQERSVTWCHWVREYLEGEVFDLADNNGNDLDDESGLTFERVGDYLAIRLTLERPDPEGRLLRSTVETSVKMRN